MTYNIYNILRKDNMRRKEISLLTLRCLIIYSFLDVGLENIENLKLFSPSKIWIENENLKIIQFS